MTESALKFGPEWLRALSHGNAVTSPPSSPCMPKYKLAEYRYGREEMLALFEKNIKIPEDLLETDGLVATKVQLPLALVATTDEEQRTWARSVNSEAVLRLMGRGSDRGPSSTSTRAGRGVSSDRGRGRGRGYYQRGVTSEDGLEGPPSGFSRPRPFERSQSMHERSQSWEDKEKERRYEKGYSESGRSFDTAWRRERLERDRETDDDGGWRTTSKESGRSFDTTWRRERLERERETDDDGGWRITSRDESNWQTSEEKETRDFDRDRSNDIVHNNETNEKHFGQAKSRRNKSWETNGSGGDKLPEWSTEDNGNVGFVGTFDSSGAFLENKCNEGQTQISGNNSTVSKNALTPSREQENKEVKSDAREMEQSNKETEELLIASAQTVQKGHGLTSNVPPKTLSPSSSSALFIQSTNQLLQPSVATKSVSSTSLFETKNSNTIPDSLNTDISVSAVDVHTRGLGNQHQPNAQMSHSITKNHVASSSSSSQTPPNLKPVDLAKTSLPIRNNSEGDRADEVNFEHLEKAAENLVAKWTAEEDEKAAQKEQATTALPLHHEDALKWFYKDPQGQVQGPFTPHEMSEWFNAGYFTMSLSVRRGCDEKFSLLGDLMKCWARIPFTPGPNPPPLLLNVALNTPAVGNPDQQPTLPSALQSPERLFLFQQHLMQQQMFHQHIIQQQLFLRYQSMIQQTLSLLKEQEGFCSLTPQQQHHLLLQHLFANQLQQIPAGPPGQESNVPDFVHQLQQLMTMNPQSKDEVMTAWNALNSSLNLGNNGKQQGTSLWDLENGIKGPEASLSTLQELERTRKEEEERVAEEEKHRQLQQQQQQQHEQLLKEKEEQKRQEEAKREEMLKLKQEEELKKQQEEEERRLEELRKEKERQLLEEQRKLEEQKRKEHLLEEERKRKEEERKRKEEERKKKELKKRQEEEQRRKEAELELQRQKELEECERREKEEQEKLAQQELQRQQELQKLEQQRRQMEVLQRLEEKQKAEKCQIPAWGVCANTAPSLVEIQKMQEEKERKEREEQKRLLQTVQQSNQLTNTQQKANSNLTWAKKPTTAGHPVKSLLEIQKEEAEKLAVQNKVFQQQQQQQKQQNQNLSLLTAGVWGNATSNLSWSSQANSSWGLESVNNSSAGCFWDDAMNASNVRRSSAQNEKTSDLKASSQNKSIHGNNPSNNKNKNSRTKKDEDTVMKIFGSHAQTADDFTQWCFQALSALQSSTVDIPTFVAFLKDVESSVDVQEYVCSYLGDNKDAQEFAKQFLDKRNRYKVQTKSRNEDKKAPPISTANVLPPQSQQYVDGESQKSGAKKKKKNKMQKVDSSILGFTVHASIDRINVGEIERVEGM